MKKRIQELVAHFNLQEHPEGGYYSEIFRSEVSIPELDRQLMTSIYFLLTSEHLSNFHRIKSDELWFFHEGNPLTVHTLDENGHTEHKVGLDLTAGQKPQLLVPAGTIFGSSVDVPNGYAFVSCTVAPGFDFRDFELFTSAELLKDYPDHSEIIHRLTAS